MIDHHSIAAKGLLQDLPPVGSIAGVTFVSRSIDTSFRFFFAGLLLVYVDIVRQSFITAGFILPRSYVTLVTLSAPCMLFISILCALAEGKLRRFQPKYRFWYLSLMTVTIVLIAYTHFFREYNSKAVTFDIIAYPFFFSGLLLGTSSKNWFHFDRLMIALFFASTVITVLAWQFAIIREGIAFHVRSKVVWTIPYVLWGLLSTWPYFFLTASEGSKIRKIITYTGIGVYFVLALFFQKRVPFAHLSLCVALFALSGWGRPTRTLRTSGRLVLGLSALAIFFWGALSFMDQSQKAEISMERLVERYRVGEGKNRGVTVGVVTQNPRWQEYKLFFQQYSLWEKCFGRGFGKSFHGWDQNIHNGTVLILAKGGFFMLFIWLSGWFSFLLDFVRNRNPVLNRYYIPVLTILLFSFTDGFISRDPRFVLLMMCAGRAMSRDALVSEIPLRCRTF